MSDKIFVLREDVEYPDGANIVEIQGAGDERQIPRYPKISVSVDPLEVYSSGLSSVLVTVTLRDYNSSNPFEGTTDVDGEGSASNRFEFTTSGFIRTSDGGVPQIRVWEDANREYEITDQIEKVEGSKVKLLDTFRSVYADPLLPEDRGLIYQKVWYRIDSGPTVSLSVGTQEEGWWEKNPDGTSKTANADDQGQVGGNFYYDSACAFIIPGNEAIAPISADQSTSLSVYFRPTQNSYGTALINAAYSGSTAETELIVKSAYVSSVEADLSAEPGSVQIGEKSLVTLRLSDKGKVLNDVNVNFILLGDTPTNDQGSIEDALAVTQAQLDKEEFPKSTEGNKISLSHNIVTIKSIEQWPNLDPPGAGGVPPGDPYWWQYQPLTYPPKIDGNTIELGAGNELPLAEMNLRVVYDTGGYASCVYVPPPTIPIVSGAKDPSITASLYALYQGLSKQLDIKVTPASSMKSDGLSIEVKSPVAPSQKALVKVWHNKGTDYNNRDVSIFYWPEGKGSGPSVVTLTKKMIVEEKQTLSSPTRVSTEYPIDHTYLPQVTYYSHTTNPPGDAQITVLSTSDTHDINLEAGIPPWPVGLKVKITYRALAYAEFDFTAPNQEMDVYINARLITGLIEENVNSTLEVSWSAANGINLSLDPENSSIPYEWQPDPPEDPQPPPVTRWYTDIEISSSYYDAEAVGNLKTAIGRTVVLTMTPTGCGVLPGSVVLASAQKTENEVQPSSKTTISTKYTMLPGTVPTVTMEYNNVPYAIDTDPEKTFGTQITLAANTFFPDSLPYCTIVYTAAAIAKVKYEATNQTYKAAVAKGSVTKDVENTDALLFIGGRMAIPNVGTGYGNCIITLNDPLANASVEIEIKDSTIYKERTSKRYENSEWRTDEEPVPEDEEDPNPKKTTMTVTVKFGGAIAPEGTEFTLYCFSQGKEPADDKHDGTVKTGGTVAGETHSVGADGTKTFTIYARDKAVDTYVFKAVVGQNSSDSSLTVEWMPDDNYLTYTIPVATIVGWMLAEPLESDPVTGSVYSRAGKEFISDNASIVSRGALKFADQYCGTDTFPEGENAADTTQDIMIKFDLPLWLDWQDCESFNISGARVLQPILKWGDGPGQISEDGAIKGLATGVSPGIFGVQWNWEFNKKAYVFSPVEKFNTVDEKGVIGCKVTLGTSTNWMSNPSATWSGTTGQDGTVTFRGVYPGTYPVYLHSPNHKGNQDPEPIWGVGAIQTVGVFDEDTLNDTLTIPEMSMKDYSLKDTEWTIEITATVKQRAKYDKLAAQTGWTPEKAENTKVNTAKSAGLVT